MKKTYIHPQAEVVEITTTRMIAVSSFGGELNSPSFDFMDNDGLLEIYLFHMKLLNMQNMH